MVPVRKTVEIAEGVRVDLLVTPHMSVYEADAGIKPIGKDASVQEVMFRYADLMYLAALNAWELDGHGTREDFPVARGDFHGFMQADRKGFAQTVTFLVSALTGKTVRELEEERKKAEESAPAEDAGENGEQEKKKTFLSRITRRLRHSS